MGEGGRGRQFGRLGVPWLHDSLRYHRASPLQVETQRSNEVKESTNVSTEVGRVLRGAAVIR